MKESLKRMGTFCAAYCGTQYLLAWKRGVQVEDPFNSMGAASVTVGAYNFMSLFHWELYRVLREDRESNSAAHPHSDQSGASAAMESLEENFNK